MAERPIARNSHYTPQAYLRGWSKDGLKIECYRLLVSHERVPVWSTQSIISVGKRADLYTRPEKGVDSDEFELWLGKEIDDPGGELLHSLRRDGELGADEWRRFAYYIAALDLRTPAGYLRMQDMWKTSIPKALDGVVKRLRKYIESGGMLPPRERLQNLKAGSFALSITVEVDPASGEQTLKAEVAAGRGAWVEEMRRLLESTAKVLCTHKWVALRPHPGCKWFTSDDPVVKLHAFRNGLFEFTGGWGKTGQEMYLPVSPELMVYTSFGSSTQFSRVCTAEETLLLQRMIASHASRMIFAESRPARAVMFKPRRIDPVQFREEEEAWAEWHKTHSSLGE